MFNFKKIIKSFKNAFYGLKIAFFSERNFRIMLGLVFVSFFLIYFFELDYIKSAIIIFAGVLMLVVELINTAFEKSLDLITKHHDDNIRYIKDIMAGAALMVSLAWLLVLVLVVII